MQKGLLRRLRKSGQNPSRETRTTLREIRQAGRIRPTRQQNINRLVQLLFDIRTSKNAIKLNDTAEALASKLHSLNATNAELNQARKYAEKMLNFEKHVVAKAKEERRIVGVQGFQKREHMTTDLAEEHVGMLFGRNQKLRREPEKREKGKAA